MKISKIEKKDGIYYMTKKPDFFERLFGKKETVDRYRYKGEVYLYFPWVKVFYDNSDEVVDIMSKECYRLNNYENSF